MKKNTGFTLAEALITIAILALVFVLATASLKKSAAKISTQNQLKKAYSSLENSLDSAFSKDISMDLEKIDAQKIFRDLLIENLNISKDCKEETSGCFSSTIKDLKGKEVKIDVKDAVILSDGTAIGNNGYEYYIDLNNTKEPNIDGVDVFHYRLEKGEIETAYIRKYSQFEDVLNMIMPSAYAASNTKTDAVFGVTPGSFTANGASCIPGNGRDVHCTAKKNQVGRLEGICTATDGLSFSYNGTPVYWGSNPKAPYDLSLSPNYPPEVSDSSDLNDYINKYKKEHNAQNVFLNGLLPGKGSTIDRHSFNDFSWPEKTLNGQKIVDIRDILFKPGIYNNGNSQFRVKDGTCITFDDPDKKDDPKPTPPPFIPTPEPKPDPTPVTPEPEPQPQPTPEPEPTAPVTPDPKPTPSTGVEPQLDPPLNGKARTMGWRFVPYGYAKQIMDNDWKIKYW